MEHGRNRGKDLETVRESLTIWRRSHGGRGRPIPAALWSDAADVARANGVAETARTLRIDRVLSAIVRSSGWGPATRVRRGRSGGRR